jgi:hypothetical protein
VTDGCVMRSMDERKILLGPGTHLGDVEAIYNYYVAEIVPSVAQKVEDEVEELKASSDKRHLFGNDYSEIYKKHSTCIIEVNGRKYEAYLTMTLFRIIRLPETVASVKL